MHSYQLRVHVHVHVSIQLVSSLQYQNTFIYFSSIKVEMSPITNDFKKTHLFIALKNLDPFDINTSYTRILFTLMDTITSRG